MKSGLVSVGAICRVLAGKGNPALSRQAISNFVQQGMPKPARGKYDLMECIDWYLARLRAAVQRKETESEDGTLLSLDKERARLVKAQADNEEMTAAERRATLIPIEIYEDETARMVGIVKAQLLNLPSRVSAKLDGLSRVESKALINVAVKQVLNDLAKNGAAAHAKRASISSSSLGTTTRRKRSASKVSKTKSRTRRR